MNLRRILWPSWRLQRLWRREDMIPYREGEFRSKFLVNLLDGIVQHDAAILELGCGAGRNLRYLQEAGYTNLEGVEINDIEIDLDVPIHRMSIQDFMDDARPRSYDLVFTMAVLEHLPKSSEWVFRDMVRIARRAVVTIEDEKTQTFMHYGRDYGKVFTVLGMEQITQEVFDDMVARLFVHPP